MLEEHLLRGRAELKIGFFTRQAKKSYAGASVQTDRCLHQANPLQNPPR